MQPIIEVHKIGKKFKIHHNKQPYLSLRDNIVQYIKNPLSLFQSSDEEFWALKDVSFNVMPGESIGIIGKNGAGKSTLLKILSRITPPSEGRIVLRGRVASLLEVGTGFHPELTGRENVYFNGAILGMNRQEIKKKFDAIVDFAGVERFIDTPLKHYSSGMQLRLAFAVAAFLEAEILVVDEVLAVGDAEFQKKCLGKMEDVTKNEGRTVLFVSHNMGVIKQLCRNAILLEKGNTKGIENVETAISAYFSNNLSANKKIDRILDQEALEKYEAKILEVELVDKNLLCHKTSFYKHEEVVIRVRYWSNTQHPIMVNFLLFNEEGIKVMIGTDASSDFYSSQKKMKGIYQTDFIVPPNFLNNNNYFIHVAIDSPVHHACYDVIMNAAMFSINEDNSKDYAHRGLLTKNYPDVATWPLINSYTKFLE